MLPLVPSGANFHTDPSIVVSPPDSDGAVGPNSFVELLNNLYQVYDKSGTLIQTLRLPDFWTAAGVTLAGLPYDPRVLYDPVSQHWFATSSENAFVPNDILVAVSNTSDPTQGWQGLAIPSDPTGQTWSDVPMLGINQDGVFIAPTRTLPEHPTSPRKRSSPFQNRTFCKRFRPWRMRQCSRTSVRATPGSIRIQPSRIS